LAHRKGRSLLTASGIVLGVAIFFGVLVTNATTSTGVDRLLRDLTGPADVLISPTGSSDVDLPPATLARLRALPDVRTAIGDYTFGARIDNGTRRQDVRIEGVDLGELARLQDVPVEDGRPPAPGAAEILVPRRLADKLRVRTGARVSASTPHGRTEVTVAGVLENKGAGRSSDERPVAYTSPAAARAMAGLAPGGINAIAVVLRRGAEADGWIAANRTALGPGLTLRNAATVAEGFRDFLKVLGGFFAFFATITLFVGAFLIYLTLSMAVVERTRVYGTMRALGATRGQIARIVVAEAAVLGAASTVAGLVAGLGIAKGLLVLVSKLFGFELPGLTVRAGAVISAVLVGVVTTLVASLLPAIRAGRLAPVLAMKGNYEAETKLGRGWIAGAVLAVTGLAMRLAGSSSQGLTSLSVLVLLLGAVLLVPLVLRPLASVLGRLTNKIAGGIGDVAVLHLVKERSRSAYTLALIMVVMSMLFAIGGLQRSITAAVRHTIDTQFGADLDVDTSGSVDASVESELRRVQGVDKVSAVRFARTYVVTPGRADREIFALVIDPATYFEVSGFDWRSGDEASARAALAGGGVLLPEGTASSFGTKRGDSITLRTASGPKAFRVGATFVSFQGMSMVVMGLGDGRAALNAGRPTSFQVSVASGASVDRVKRAIEQGPGKRYPLEVQTATDIKKEASGQLGQYFNIFYAILLVAAITGLLSLANTLAVSVVRRYREIGILRAIGVTRAQVWRMVLVESATLGLAAFVLSVPLGWLMSSVAVSGTSDAFHLSVPYRYPAAWVPIVALFGIIVAVVAAIAPGRRAARLEVVGALQYE
jgi:putative ABC transport system permease protein